MTVEEKLTWEKISSGSHFTIWLDSPQNNFQYTPLRQNIETDVVIVGGGIAGVSIAYNLCRANKKVVLVEDGNIASGESGRTTAHLVNALDDRYYELQRIFGKEKTRLAAESHTRAIDFIEETVAREKH